MSTTSMDSPLRDRSGLIVGGANGIGRATAELLAIADAHVIIADPDVGACRDLQERHPDRITLVRTDATDAAQVEEAVAVAAGGSGMDYVVHTPMVDRRGSVLEIAEGDWDLVQDVVLKSAMLVVKHAAPRLRPGSSVVLLSSVQARFGNPAQAAYSAAKAGIEGLIRQMAVDLGPRGIRVNGVAPSLVLVDRNRPGLEADPMQLRRFTEAFPLRRLCTPEEVAPVVAFLLSDGAAFVHGTTIAVDGGISAGASLHAFEAGYAFASQGGAHS